MKIFHQILTSDPQFYLSVCLAASCFSSKFSFELQRIEEACCLHGSRGRENDSSSPLDFPIIWERPKLGRRPDIFPQFSPMKTPLPPPMPADPPEEEEEDDEKKEEEEEDPQRKKNRKR